MKLSKKIFILRIRILGWVIFSEDESTYRLPCLIRHHKNAYLLNKFKVSGKTNQHIQSLYVQSSLLPPTPELSVICLISFTFSCPEYISMVLLRRASLHQLLSLVCFPSQFDGVQFQGGSQKITYSFIFACAFTLWQLLHALILRRLLFLQ